MFEGVKGSRNEQRVGCGERDGEGSEAKGLKTGVDLRSDREGRHAREEGREREREREEESSGRETHREGGGGGHACEVADWWGACPKTRGRKGGVQRRKTFRKMRKALQQNLWNSK